MMLTDTGDELALVRRGVGALGVRCAVTEHRAKRGERTLELADAVMDACCEETMLKFLCPQEMKLGDVPRVPGVFDALE